MTPSPADRQPWLMAGIYIGLALGVAYLLGALSWLPVGLGEQRGGGLAGVDPGLHLHLDC